MECKSFLSFSPYYLCMFYSLRYGDQIATKKTAIIPNIIAMKWLHSNGKARLHTGCIIQIDHAVRSVCIKSTSCWVSLNCQFLMLLRITCLCKSFTSVFVCACVCVCVHVRERERERENNKAKEKYEISTCTTFPSPMPEHFSSTCTYAMAGLYRQLRGPQITVGNAAINDGWGKTLWNT